MLKDYAPLTKLLWVIAALWVVRELARLSYGWSIDQTELFAVVLVGTRRAVQVAWVFQLGPQVLFAISKTASDRRQPFIATWTWRGGWALNVIDAFTNLVAFNVSVPGYVAEAKLVGANDLMIKAGIPLGYILAILVTFFEELIAVTLAAAAGWTGEFLRGMNWLQGSRIVKGLDGLGGNLRATSGFTAPTQPGGQGNKPSPAQPTPHQQVINVPAPPRDKKRERGGK